ncbi:hypothetical protein J2Z21_005968 [Streptomyces griseochromogenes]|uniref:Uncharacterized protein n=1 Tax=Streptomyces griseochromogenes TaxID=68214 RepID=A0ABS4LZY8_9ACTN|nr:hypothetical protein [Streptomyces griseochromogenes]MBP2052979.1 hypothetical protein [Streptomyces griseochromogenes]
MRWTDESGVAYGEDPYGGVGYTYAYGHEYGRGATAGYAYGHEYGRGATADTVPQPWGGARPAQWTHPAGHAPTGWHSPHGDVPTGWHSPHGDVLTAQLPVPDPPGCSVSETDIPESESVRPVFVDSSGRRQRHVHRAARLLVIPAAGYVALLISTMLGGPGISSPFVPQADPTHPATPRSTAPDSPSGTGHSTKGASPAATRKSSGSAARKGSGTAAPKAPGPTGRSAASTAPAATSRPSAAPTSTAAPAHSSKGRGLGSSHRPVK